MVAVSENPSDRPLACAFYWRRNNQATANFPADWLEQRWATVTQSLQNAELVSVCTSMDDVRQAGAATERVYRFANDLEPYFHRSSPRLPESLSRQVDRPQAPPKPVFLRA